MDVQKSYTGTCNNNKSLPSPHLFDNVVYEPCVFVFWQNGKDKNEKRLFLPPGLFLENKLEAGLMFFPPYRAFMDHKETKSYPLGLH